jgi:hypothetical protein
VTPKDVINKLLALNKKGAAGKITPAQFADEADDILTKARIALTDKEFFEVRHDILAVHSLLAQYLSEYGRNVPGNDPQKPN